MPRTSSTTAVHWQTAGGVSKKPAQIVLSTALGVKEPADIAPRITMRRLRQPAGGPSKG